MNKSFQADIGFCWAWGAGGNFLLGLRHKQGLEWINKITGEYYFSKEYRIHVDPLDQFDETMWKKRNITQKQIAYTFHQLPISLLKNRYLDISSKNFFVLKCDHNELKYVSSILFLYWWFDQSYLNVSQGLKVVKTLSTISGLSQDYADRMLDKVKQIDENIRNRFDVFFNYDGMSKISVKYYLDCIKNQREPNYHHYLTFLKEEYNESYVTSAYQHSFSSQEHYDKLKNSGYNIIELSYSDVFFKKKLPHSFMVVDDEKNKEIHNFSQTRLRLVKQFNDIVNFDWPECEKFILEKQEILNKS